MWFEPTIPASERAKTVHTLHRAATVSAMGYTITKGNYQRMRVSRAWKKKTTEFSFPMT
jgi:hypothetical protein